MNDWRINHGKAIHGFLEYLNEKSDEYILKGGTALFTCYNLDRFSEDIDLDGKNQDVETFIKSFCDIYGYSYRIAKNSDTVKRYMINYGNDSKPLKVEVSFRRKEIPENEVTVIDGIRVYKINTLCIMKTNAYSNRDRIRDLYDLSFITNNYYSQLSTETITILQAAVQYKGIEQFDYIIREQHDELIDEDKLANDFLSMYNKLGLLYDEKERQMISSLGKDLIEEKTFENNKQTSGNIKDRDLEDGLCL